MDPTTPTWLNLLQAYRVPLTPQAALTYLTLPKSECGARKSEALFLIRTSAFRLRHSPREWECFRLVYAQLFPLDRDWLLDLDEDPDNRGPTLPISPISLELIVSLDSE